MKKSDMVKLLEQHLIEDQGLDFLTDAPVVVAKDILNFLESKGMVPPTIKEWQIVNGTFLGDGFQIARTVNKWELEDELP